MGVHNISMRKIIRVCQAECYHFLCSGRLALVLAVWVFAYQFITVPLLRNAERMHASLLVIEPYIALINSNFMILIMPVLFLVLLSDFPRVDANAYFYLVRTGKTNWVLGQLLYGVVITAGYLLMQFAGMVIPVLAEGRWGTGWSPVITDFAREFPEYAQSAGAVSIQPQLYYHVPPWEAVLVGSALLAAYLYQTFVLSPSGEDNGAVTVLFRHCVWHRIVYDIFTDAVFDADGKQHFGDSLQPVLYGNGISARIQCYIFCHVDRRFDNRDYRIAEKVRRAGT